MKPKQFIILLVVVAVLGLAAYMVNHSEDDSWEGGENSVNQTLLSEDFDSGKVAAVTIREGERSVTLEKTADGWKVRERYNYPANLPEMKDFIITLMQTKVARELMLSAEQLADLKLKEGEGVSVAFLDADAKVMAAIVFGKKHEKATEAQESMGPYGMMGNVDSMGRYILLPGDKAVIAANTFALVDEPVTNWLDKDFIKISDMKMGSLSENGKTLWTVSRDNKSADLTLQGGEVPEGKMVDAGKLSSIKSAFSWIRFNDVADPEASAESLGMDKAKIFTVSDFDGLTYTLQMGAVVDGKQYLRIQSVRWSGQETRQPAEGESPEDKARLDAEFEKANKENQEKATRMNVQFSPWTYEVGTYALSNVGKTFDELLKDLPKPPPEEKNEAEK